jgi:UDP-3-O-[3-hydroxymyristoyl] glucosamine N-acyltransferase
MRESRDFDEIVVYGSRGFSEMILRGMDEVWLGRVRVLAMVDDLENGHQHPGLGVPVLSAAERRARFSDVPVFVTPGSSALRAKLIARLAEEEATLATVVFPQLSHVHPGTVYGAGCHCAHYTRIGPNVRIGEGAQVLGPVLAHDVTIGDFATIGVGASVLGHAEIGEAAQIAPCAVIGNGRRNRPLRIGAGAVVGSGAVVHQDVPDGARVMGNPAMPVRDWMRLRRLLRTGG